jgi:hypothetical protein
VKTSSLNIEKSLHVLRNLDIGESVLEYVKSSSFVVHYKSLLR